MEKLQKDLDRLGEWAVENAMKINSSKSKAICFTTARVKDPPNYSLTLQRGVTSTAHHGACSYSFVHILTT